MLLRELAFGTCCLLLAPAQADSGVEDPIPQIVRSQTQWEALLASGQRTPLDALTPYGKRRFIASITWGRSGLGGFGYTPLIRELNEDQLLAVLGFVGSADSVNWLRDELVGPQLRLTAPSMVVEQRLASLESFADHETEKDSKAPPSSSARGGGTVLRRYEDLFGDRARHPVLQRQATEDLPLIFDAAALANEKNPGSRALTDMIEIHREMAARSLDTRRSFDGSILTAFIAAREFEQARKFASSRPHLAIREIPKVADSLGSGFAGRTVFEYDQASKTLTRRALPYAA